MTTYVVIAIIVLSLLLFGFALYIYYNRQQKSKSPPPQFHSETTQNSEALSPTLLRKTTPQTETVSDRGQEFIQAALKAKLNIVFAGSSPQGPIAFIKTLYPDLPASKSILMIDDPDDVDLMINGPGGVIAYSGSQSNARAVLSYLEDMYQHIGGRVATYDMRMRIIDGVDLICIFASLEPNVDRVLTISELQGIKGQNITLSDVFTFDKIAQRLKPTGLQPKCIKRLEAAGITLPQSTFKLR